MCTYFTDSPNCVFVDASMMDLIVIIFVNHQKKKLIWFGNKLKIKCVRKPTLAKLGAWSFKDISPVQTIVVPLGETLQANYLLPFLSSYASLLPFPFPLWKLARQPLIPIILIQVFFQDRFYSQVVCRFIPNFQVYKLWSL